MLPGFEPRHKLAATQLLFLFKQFQRAEKLTQSASQTTIGDGLLCATQKTQRLEDEICREEV